MKKELLIIFIFMFSFVFAAATHSGTNSIERALCEVYCLVNGVLPVLAFVLMVLAGVAYAAGQFFGAEMRAKAVGWAMNMITGAIIGLILSAVGPSILTSLGGAGTFEKCSCS